jgi:CRP-like cAMP-binding protein
MVKKGNIVFHFGERGDNFYLIIRGTVLVYVPKK